MGKLDGKVAIVTGGSNGIGFAVVRGFLQEGAKVVLCGSRKETADAAVEKLLQENPEYVVEGIYPDITNYEGVHECVNGLIEKYGKIDILVNNAGISDAHTFLEYDAESFKKVIDLNLLSAFNFSHAVLPNMVERNAGSIINTASISGRDGAPSGIAYPITKAALVSMTTCLAREFAPKQIRVNAIGPGMTRTNMTNGVPEEYIKAMEQSIPMGYFAEPEDMVGAYVLLASDDSKYISGQFLCIDGMCRI